MIEIVYMWAFYSAIIAVMIWAQYETNKKLRDVIRRLEELESENTYLVYKKACSNYSKENAYGN